MASEKHILYYGMKVGDATLIQNLIRMGMRYGLLIKVTFIEDMVADRSNRTDPVDTIEGLLEHMEANLEKYDLFISSDTDIDLSAFEAVRDKTKFKGDLGILCNGKHREISEELANSVDFYDNLSVGTPEAAWYNLVQKLQT